MILLATALTLSLAGMTYMSNGRGQFHKPAITVRIGTAAFHTEPGCLPSVKAITYYRKAYTASRTAMNLAGAVPRVWYQQCPAIKRRAVEWRSRARKAERELAAWKREWAAPPEPFLSIARCENRGSGPHGVNWDAYNSTYEGAYGFLHSTWDDYKPRGYPANANQATPRQQTDVARILVREFGGYSSWPACHIRLGLPG